MTYVGLPGSGKSLFNSYIAYTELTRIMNNHKPKSFIKDHFREFSYYDKVVLNTDFNDGRGNWTKWIYSFEECTCYKKDLEEFRPHWESAGYCLGVTDLDELYNEKNALVLLDEAGTQFANVDWDKMPPDYRHFLTQHRKNITHLPKRFDIYVYTQHKDLIEITLRRISDRVYLIRPLFGFSKNPTRPNIFSTIPAIKLYVYWRHELLEGKPTINVNSDGTFQELDEEDKLESIEFVTWYYIGKKYRKCYDTLYKVRKMTREKLLK